jgi:hypothetical protein
VWLCSLWLVLSVLPASAVECGETLGPGGVYTLIFGGLLILEGEGVILENGFIRCPTGCFRGGRRAHRLSQITFETHSYEAIILAIADTIFEDLALDSGGVFLTGDGNRLLRLTNTAEGAITIDGDWNVLRDSHFRQNHTGITLIGSHNAVIESSVTDTNEYQLLVQGDQNLILRNVLMGPAEFGLVISGTGNCILRNTSLNHHGFDLVDMSGTCTTNVWRKNVAETAEPECLLDSSAPPPPAVTAGD